MVLRRLSSRRVGRAGFTLIELMVAIAIGAFVIAALYQLFRAQMRQFVFQDQQMEMHQNARLAADILTRTARMAGYGTASGYTAGVFGDQGDTNSVLSAVIQRNGTGDNGSDVVTFVSMDPSLEMNTAAPSPPPCNTTTLQFSPTALHNSARLAQYQNGELVMCYDPAGIGSFTSYLWSLSGSGDPTGGYLYVSDNSGYADYASVCGTGNNLPLVMMCSRAEVATFYVDATDDGVGPGTPEHPVLMMDLNFHSPDDDDVPVVDDVEDLQVAYCLQNNASLGTSGCSSAGDWVNEIDESTVRDLYMVRLSFIVRSSRPDIQGLYDGLRPALEDHAAGTSGDADHYFRQVVSTEVAVRNLRLQAQLFP